MGLVLLILYIIIQRILFKRKKTEQKLIKANRLYATISQVNQTIVHVGEPGELFKRVCRIAVEAGASGRLPKGKAQDKLIDAVRMVLMK